ncbi:3-hydroxyisobutyrate dehydrogenase [Algicola sagamiensis]|uniref:3-hydroxyisobutyrate dehydrogenase n=1 Tax=Algicola sagamiensis TaxID=163869 RepID=UPI00037FD29C|nr:3-hydroxyisobutyrate dehydrogenase [Algicola sagamiensis]
MASIYFIGLGHMGAPMAQNLLKAGHDVTVFDLNVNAMQQLEDMGAATVSSIEQGVEGVDFIISMLPAGKHVKAVYLGEEGLVHHIDKKSLVIDCSTIASTDAQAVATVLQENGIRFIDAPVSGGVAGAAAGTLTFITGGKSADVDQAQVVLKSMGHHVFHAGDVGAGQIAKICNNMLLSVLMIGTSEALQLGADHGLDPKVLSEIMRNSSGGNWTLEKYNPCPGVMPQAPSSNEYQGGFMVDLMAKDLGLAMETALNSGSTTPMGALARSFYTQHQRAGQGEKDFSSIFELFQK